MTILSPLMSYIVDKEVGFPIPSEKEKINKTLKRYRSILSQHPERSDAPEIMFGIADLLVGRGEEGDYAEAGEILDKILVKNPPEYLKARALVGKADLAIGRREEFDGAVSLCEKARQILKNNLADFFAAKTFMVEAELRLARQEKGDWQKALDLASRVANERRAHWYFRGRALLTKAEIIFYRSPDKLGESLKLVDKSVRSLSSRPDDYFAIKGKVLKSEILIRRNKKDDDCRAEKLLKEALKLDSPYQDLTARAKISLAEVVSRKQADALLREVDEMEGLDPYLVEKARLVERSLKEKGKK